MPDQSEIVHRIPDGMMRFGKERPIPEPRIVRSGTFSIAGMTYLAAEIKMMSALPPVPEGHQRFMMNIHVDDMENVEWQTIDAPIPAGLTIAAR